MLDRNGAMGRTLHNTATRRGAVCDTIVGGLRILC